MVEYLRLTEEGLLPALNVQAPYKCVVIIESAVSSQRQMEISRWLIRTGCMYMMAWGVGCSSWDDSVDLANLEPFDFNDIPDESFVMTTWHESDTLQEVFEFSRLHVTELPQTLVLQINGVDRATELTEMAKSA